MSTNILSPFKFRENVDSQLSFKSNLSLELKRKYPLYIPDEIEIENNPNLSLSQHIPNDEKIGIIYTAMTYTPSLFELNLYTGKKEISLTSSNIFIKIGHHFSNFTESNNKYIIKIKREFQTGNPFLINFLNAWCFTDIDLTELKKVEENIRIFALKSGALNIYNYRGGIEWLIFPTWDIYNLFIINITHIFLHEYHYLPNDANLTISLNIDKNFYKKLKKGENPIEIVNENPKIVEENITFDGSIINFTSIDINKDSIVKVCELSYKLINQLNELEDEEDLDNLDNIENIYELKKILTSTKNKKKEKVTYFLQSILINNPIKISKIPSDIIKKYIFTGNDTEISFKFQILNNDKLFYEDPEYKLYAKNILQKSYYLIKNTKERSPISISYIIAGVYPNLYNAIDSGQLLTDLLINLSKKLKKK